LALFMSTVCENFSLWLARHDPVDRQSKDTAALKLQSRLTEGVGRDEFHWPLSLVIRRRIAKVTRSSYGAFVSPCFAASGRRIVRSCLKVSHDVIAYASCEIDAGLNVACGLPVSVRHPK